MDPASAGYNWSTIWSAVSAIATAPERASPAFSGTGESASARALFGARRARPPSRASSTRPAGDLSFIPLPKSWLRKSFPLRPCHFPAPRGKRTENRRIIIPVRPRKNRSMGKSSLPADGNYLRSCRVGRCRNAGRQAVPSSKRCQNSRLH